MLKHVNKMTCDNIFKDIKIYFMVCLFHMLTL